MAGNRDATGTTAPTGSACCLSSEVSMPRFLLVFFAFVCLALAPLALADNASAPIGEPVLEHPTLHCLGVYWIVRGDDNRNAAISVDYRKSGGQVWQKAMPL